MHANENQQGDTTPLDLPGRLIPLGEVRNLPWLPRRKGEKRLSLSTIFRWAQKGVRGRRLRVVSVGGLKSTTEQWVLDFFEGLANGPAGAPARTPAGRRRDLDRTERELEEIGI